MKGYTGRVMRDLRRHLQDVPSGILRDRIRGKLALVLLLLHQPQRGSGKIYAVHKSYAGKRVTVFEKAAYRGG